MPRWFAVCRFPKLAQRLAVLGIPPDHLLVRLREIPREDWGIKGLSAVDIDLGFEVEV